MINNRIWVIGASLLAIVIVAGGYFVGISPLLASANQSDSDRAVVEQQNAGQEAALTALKEQYAGLGTIQAGLDAKRASIPSTADYADFLGELDARTTSAGVVMTDLTVSDAVAYATPAPAVEPVPTPTDGAATDATTTDANAATETAPAAVAPVDPATAVPAAPVANAGLVTAENFVVIPISLSVSGDFDKVMGFVDTLQTGDGRLYFVSGISVLQDEQTGGFSGDITGYVFVLTDSLASGTTPTEAGVESSVTSIG